MIAYISGRIIEKEEKSLIIDVHGIGYRVRVGSALREKVHEGDDVSLRVYHHITEGGQQLFGFDDKLELAYFELLMTVPSVGAKTARTILDVAPPAVLEQAVSAGDVALLTKVSGVGKKTAGRLVVELKEKLGVPQKASASGHVQQEVIEALISIGYTSAQARKAAGNLPESVATVEEAVRLILREHA